MANVVKEKSFAFAKRIVRLYKVLCEERSEYVLSKQLLRSGTSIGANIVEGLTGFSRKDFTYKLQTSYKECAESMYWLELLHSCNYLNKQEFDSLHSDCSELLKLLTSILKSTKEKNRN